MNTRKFLSRTAFVLSLPWGLALAGPLADSPLSLKGAVPPNVLFAISVEFPTANTAAYQGSNDYSAANEYLGYFDPLKCYTYSSANGWFNPATAASISTDDVTSHTCAATGYWSGNLLNWASMTGLDEFRYAMTGGHRYRDTATETVIERTYQSGQGGTSNFPDKTFTDSDGTSTPFGAGTTLTFQNQGLDVRMQISTGASTDVGTCANPVLAAGVFSCSGGITTNSTGSGACTAVTGTGTSANPYRCTAMSNGFSIGTAPLNINAVTPPTPAGGFTAATVNCSGPQLAGGTTFECSSGITLGSTSSHASCNTWVGNGTSGNPYKCTSFSTFSGGETFSPGGATTSSTFTATALGAEQTTTNIDCSVSSTTPYTTTCTFGGRQATCSAYTGSGTKRCSTFGFRDGEEYVSSSRVSGYTTSRGGNNYATRYDITYKPLVNSTYYYVSSYAGTTGAGYYYTSTYNLTWAATSNPYFVRVKVCDSIGYEDNCVQYGSSRKPTGVIQDNGDRMRFGVFSYYNANDIDNAVMRSKLKYVAPLKYSPSGTSVTNTLAEWNATDGTLIQDPDYSDTDTRNSFVGVTGNSGVINYLNKFGRTAQSYKTYDNIGKLYYEAQKYMRGLQATPAFYQGAKASNADGFPVISNWNNSSTPDDDPAQYSCQKNYIITMGDTHTHCDKRLPGGSINSSGSSQCNAYTDGNSNSHPADQGSLSGDSGVNVTTETSAVDTLEGALNSINLSTSTFSGSASYYMAGLAKFGASTDIRPDLIGKQTITTFIINVEEYKDCGYNSQFWLAAKYGNPPSYDLTSGNWLATQTAEQQWSQTLNLPAGGCSTSYATPPGYANASGGNVTWPKNLLRAGNPLSMIASVRSAISQIAAQVGVESGLAQSSGSIDTGTGAYVYRAMYNSGGWTGDVVALTVSTDATISQTPAWSASGSLPIPANRRIYTFNDGQAADRSNESSGSIRRGQAFTVANFNNLSSYQKAALNKNIFGAVDNYGTDRISFLLGNRDGETFLPGTTNLNPSANNRGFRSRSSVLGDFLNSTPLFVGAPQSSISGNAYRAFAAANINRRKMLYVGGNDGMLHALDASYTVNSTTGLPVVTSTSGTEVFGYVPSAVYSKLSNLTADNYSHKFYVDGTPVVADACMNTTCTTSADWKSVLVGGLNAGGQGIYALDVSNPDAFDASKVMWEFNDQDDPDLGYTFGKPVIAKLNNNRWAVIFGNGYNNTVSDNKVSTTGRAYLFIVYIDGPGVGNTWVENTNYVKIPLKDPGEPATLPSNPANGLGHILAFDKNLDGKVDYVYATDRKGNLWKINLSSTSPASWGAAFGTAADPLPLFTAQTSAGGAQQFTTGLSISRHPYGGFMIMSGTGSWIDTTDAVITNSDTFYGIWDKDDGTRVTRSRLQRQRPLLYTNYLGGNGVTSSGVACTVPSAGCSACTGTKAGCVTLTTNCAPNYSATATTTSNATVTCPSDVASPVATTTRLGWAYEELPLASSPPALPASQLGTSVGERTHSDRPSVLGSIVAFETLTPASDPCTGNTSGTGYYLSWLTGSAPTSGVSLSVLSPTGKVTVPNGTLSGQSAPLGIAISGTAHGTGASKGAANLTARKEFCSALPPGTPGAPPAPCTGANCVGYVPGWGFLSNLSGARSQPTRCICAAQSEVTGNNTAISEKCNPKLIPSQMGRLTWKQISR